MFMDVMGWYGPLLILITKRVTLWEERWFTDEILKINFYIYYNTCVHIECKRYVHSHIETHVFGYSRDSLFELFSLQKEMDNQFPGSLWPLICLIDLWIWCYQSIRQSQVSWSTMVCPWGTCHILILYHVILQTACVSKDMAEPLILTLFEL